MIAESSEPSSLEPSSLEDKLFALLKKTGSLTSFEADNKFLRLWHRRHGECFVRSTTSFSDVVEKLLAWHTEAQATRKEGGDAPGGASLLNYLRVAKRLWKLFHQDEHLSAVELQQFSDMVIHFLVYPLL